MTLTTSQMRRHAELLRARDTSPEAVAIAAEIEAEAELADAIADRPAIVAESARMVEEYPILGRITREGGRIVEIEHPWNEVQAEWARGHNVDVAWQWCHDPMAGLRQADLLRIWIGTRETGPLLQWDRTSRKWFVLSNQRGFGNNWACGGRWAGRDKIGSATLDEALAKLPVAQAEQIRLAMAD